jgi:ElaB/YqjD/DUF883 family membrane-anchored ribosome-binding protein
MHIMAQTTAPRLKEVNTDDIEDQLAALKSDIAGLTKALADYTQAQGNNLSATASDKVDAAKVKSADAAHQAAVRAEEAYLVARGKANDALAISEDAVRQNPATAVGLAAGFGFLAGLVMARR